MAIVYFGYLFDSEAFLKKMEPVLPEIINGNYELLGKLSPESVM